MIDRRFYSYREEGLSLADLCAKLDVTCPEGTFAEIIIVKPAALIGSRTGDITFFENRRHLEALKQSGASACFVTEKLAQLVADQNIVPILTQTPKYHLALATDVLVSEAQVAQNIDPTANIHPSVHIGPGVTIGEDVTIGPNAAITYAHIGSGSRIGACTVIGGSGFGVAVGPDGAVLPVPHIGRVVIGKNVRIGSNSCVDRGQLGDTQIGDDCQIDNLVQIAHNCVLERGCMLAGRVGLSGSCHIGEGVMMGGSAGLADHISIGAGARLAAFAGVMSNVPAGETWSGIPAMPIREHMKSVAFLKKSIRRAKKRD